MISDLHLHTRLSSDAEQAEWNNVCGFADKARERGLKYIAITEHKDIMPDKGTGGLINADLEKCAELVAAEKRKMLEEGRSSLTLLHGVELAHQHTHPKESAEIISAHSYDFVLGSLHVLKNEFDFCTTDYSSFSDELIGKLFKNYLEELYEIAEKCDFDSFAHCTYPLRYFSASGRLTELCAEPAKNAPEYADIFAKLIERGKALEINTSGIKKGSFTLPTADLLKLYFDLGGRYVTVGSDSHDIKFVGSGVDVAEQMLKEIGFEGVTVYVARKARIIPFK